MESNNGEAKIQKVKNWSPVWIFPIVTALIGAWVLFYHYSHQGPEVTLITANADKPRLTAVELTSAWLKAPHWLMI